MDLELVTGMEWVELLNGTIGVVTQIDSALASHPRRTEPRWVAWRASFVRFAEGARVPPLMPLPPPLPSIVVRPDSVRRLLEWDAAARAWAAWWQRSGVETGPLPSRPQPRTVDSSALGLASGFGFGTALVLGLALALLVRR